MIDLCPKNEQLKSFLQLIILIYSKSSDSSSNDDLQGMMPIPPNVLISPIKLLTKEEIAQQKAIKIRTTLTPNNKSSLSLNETPSPYSSCETSRSSPNEPVNTSISKEISSNESSTLSSSSLSELFGPSFSAQPSKSQEQSDRIRKKCKFPMLTPSQTEKRSIKALTIPTVRLSDIVLEIYAKSANKRGSVTTMLPTTHQSGIKSLSSRP
ncbi:2353_t:CDS:2, partial [Ambispora gerdemannii]